MTDRAAQLSYYLICSLFPFLLFLAALSAYLPIDRAADWLMSRLVAVLPRAPLTLIHDQLLALIRRPRPRVLTAGLVLTIWSASQGVNEARRCLNRAYEIKETRSFWQRQALAVSITVGGAMALVIGPALIVAGSRAGAEVSTWLGVGRDWQTAMWLFRWPICGIVLVALASFAYAYLPNLGVRPKAVTLGAIFGTLMWLSGSWGFALFAKHVARYDVAYGAIGGIIFLLAWLYVCAFTFLVGGEVNAIVCQHRMAMRGGHP